MLDNYIKSIWLSTSINNNAQNKLIPSDLIAVNIEPESFSVSQNNNQEIISPIQIFVLILRMEKSLYV